MNISTSKENADYTWAVQLNRCLLDIVGLWPAVYRGRKRFFAILRAVLSFMITLFVCTIPSLCLLIVNREDLTLFIDNLGYAIPLMVSQMKFIIIYKQKKVLLPIVNMMAEDWAKPKSDTERLVMIRRARLGRTIGVFLYTLLIVLIALMFTLPRFGIIMRYVANGTNIRRTFPFPAYYVQNVYRSPYYETFLVLQLMVALILVATYTGIDNFLAILIFHVSGQLENLRARLGSIKGSEHFDHVLTTVVEDHMRLIRAVDIIENSFTVLLLLMLLNFIIFACVYGLLLISIFGDKSHNSTFRMCFVLGVLVNTFLQTFLYCQAGQILTTQSEGLYDAVYECDWLSLKTKEAKSLILIMARTMTPLHITAGKLFPMTMLTFCNILKVSLSYISFLMAKL